MRTFCLKEAAIFLKMTPEGLRRKAAKGTIPGAKPGKCWCFREDDLAEFLRSFYSRAAESSQGVIESYRRKSWHYEKEVTSGGSELATEDSAYNKALALPTK